MQVPKIEHKFLISPMDAIRTQISFQTTIGPKARVKTNQLDFTEMTLVAVLKLQEKNLTIQELCDQAFPEVYGSDESGVSEHIRKQQLRNRISGLVKKGFLMKVPDTENKRNMKVAVTDHLTLTVPVVNSMIVYKLFTPQTA